MLYYPASRTTLGLSLYNVTVMGALYKLYSARPAWDRKVLGRQRESLLKMHSAGPANSPGLCGLARLVEALCSWWAGSGGWWKIRRNVWSDPCRGVAYRHGDSQTLPGRLAGMCHPLSMVCLCPASWLTAGPLETGPRNRLQ